MAEQSTDKKKQWFEKISRSGYFFGALLLHLIVFIMVATWVIFPAFHPPTEDFTKTYLPPASPPPPPPQPQQTMPVPTQSVATPTTTITSPSPTATFSVPMPDITPSTTPVEVTQKMTQKVESKPNTLSTARLSKIMTTEQSWGRDRNNILESGSDPRNVKATFPVYLASYAHGDWYCNIHQTAGQIDSGSLPNLVAKMNEWSHGNITGTVIPTPLNIGGPDLLDKSRPLFSSPGTRISR